MALEPPATPQHSPASEAAAARGFHKTDRWTVVPPDRSRPSLSRSVTADPGRSTGQRPLPRADPGPRVRVDERSLLKAGRGWGLRGAAAPRGLSQEFPDPHRKRRASATGVRYHRALAPRFAEGRTASARHRLPPFRCVLSRSLFGISPVLCLFASRLLCSIVERFGPRQCSRVFPLVTQLVVRAAGSDLVWVAWPRR